MTTQREELAGIIYSVRRSSHAYRDSLEYSIADALTPFIERVKAEAVVAALRAMAEDVTSDCAYQTEEYGACDECSPIAELLEQRADAIEKGIN